MKRKICDKNAETCWSLHALWDAEILKSIREIDLFLYWESDNFTFDMEVWALRLNQYICKIYDYPENFGLEEYIDKFRFTALLLVYEAARNTAAILNSNSGPPRREKLANAF